MTKTLRGIVIPQKRLRFLLSGLILLSCTAFQGFLPALSQELESDPTITAQKFKQMEERSAMQGVNLKGQVDKQGEKPGNVTLQAGVSRLDAAIEQEQDVDWYKWYLMARDYIYRSGGIDCPLGTNIIFNKDGRMQAESPFAYCQYSVGVMRFPLPKNTRLSAVILPTRPGKAPPASPEELIKRIRNSQ